MNWGVVGAVGTIEGVVLGVLLAGGKVGQRATRIVVACSAVSVALLAGFLERASDNGHVALHPRATTSEESTTRPLDTLPSTMNRNVRAIRLTELKITCASMNNTMKHGTRIEVTYDFYANAAGQVGLGVGLYDEQGTDYSDGNNNEDAVGIAMGHNSLSRPFVLPTVPPGTYELDGEVWPANKIGWDGFDTLTDAPCTRSGKSTFTVSR